MRDVNVIRPLALFAFLGVATARPTVVDYGTTKPSRFDEYVTDEPGSAERGLHVLRSTNRDDLSATSGQPPAVLAPAHGPHYHEVVFDMSSESTGDYFDDGLHDSAFGNFPGGPTHYSPSYESAIHSFGSLQDLSSGPEHSVAHTGVAKRSLVSRGRPGTRPRPTTAVPRKAPFSVGYTREDYWRPLSTSVHSYASSHRELFNVPPFTTVTGLRHR
ncbi:hypothetical protein V5799_019860 [Amblyomma americanum]|uniref:Secreted protein n=1 Tax=Amblyomma americanum TaxID=6943 RepID=A0AAQ4EVQ2_AMBAM